MGSPIKRFTNTQIPNTITLPAGTNINTTTLTTAGASITVNSPGTYWVSNTSGSWVIPHQVDIKDIEMKVDGLHISVGSSPSDTTYVISKDAFEKFLKMLHTIDFNERVDKLLEGDDEKA